jgi:uncharacterized protein YndB with AHSA1/START domain
MSELLPRVERTVELMASPIQLWEHLVRGELASMWMGGEMEIEDRLGGRVSLRSPGASPVFGTVEELAAGQSITWTWRSSETEPTQVTLRLEPNGSGCRLSVTEEMLPYEIVVIPPLIG